MKVILRDEVLASIITEDVKVKVSFNEVDASVVTYDVEITSASPSDLLKPGINVSADSEIAKKPNALSAENGIIFGYYSARRAARLNPIQALRYE